MTAATPAGAEGSGAFVDSVPKGVTPPIHREGSRGFLSDVIVEMGLLDHEPVERAVEEARFEARPMARILLESGALTDDQISRAIAERHGLDHVDLDEFDVDPGAVGIISYSAALRYHAVPIAFAPDGALIVAVADPVDAIAVSDIAVMTKNEVRVVVASAVAIESVIERLRAVEESRAAANPRPATGTFSWPEPPEPGPSNLEPALEPPAEAGSRTKQPATDEISSAEAPDRSDLDTSGTQPRSEPRHPAARLDELESRAQRAETRCLELEGDCARLREEASEAAVAHGRLRRELEAAVEARERTRDEAAGLAEELRSTRERAAEARRSAEASAERVLKLEVAVTWLTQQRDELVAQLMRLSAVAAEAGEVARRFTTGTKAPAVGQASDDDPANDGSDRHAEPSRKGHRIDF